jgi:HlyD family secretion protein
MNPEHANSYEKGLRHLAIYGVSAIALFMGTVGLWATTTELSGAVIASGQFVVDISVKKVQHMSGGVVSEVRVREGSRVREGDLVMRIDDTMLRANLQIVTKQLDEFAARRERLNAERDQLTDIALPEEFKDRMDDPEVVHLFATEKRLFIARRTAREGLKAQLAQRELQLEEEVNGLAAQVDSRNRQLIFIKPELEGVRDLYLKKLVAITRLNALERDAAAIDGQIGQLIAQIAQARGKATELKLQIIQVDEDLRAEVNKDLREIQGRTAELRERKVAADDQLKRTDIRAPGSGYVHQLTVQTVGGVLPPMEAAMLIVPEDEGLQLEVRVQPQDVDQLRIGQPAVVKINAFNQRTTPEIKAKVSRVSADVSRDPQTGASYYTARIAIPVSEIERLGDVKILPGMQADVYMQTSSRTLLAYMAKPLKEQFEKAFKER